jgi:peptidyl-prolyl cis-trans isomerase SurA
MTVQAQRFGILAICAALGLAALFPAPPARAQETVERIAAVVNDRIISVSDLDRRMTMAILSSELPNTQEVRDRIRPQVLRALVDEQLQLQEARRLEVDVTEQEISNALGALAQQNNMEFAQFEQMLTSRGVPVQSLREQLRAQIAWSRVVQGRLTPRVEISEEEIDAVLNRLQATQGRDEYLLAEIFLAVDNPSRETEVRQFAERLVDQVRAGANFAELARQFSQAAGAINGGDLGWVLQGELAPEIDTVVRAMGAGQISAPIRDVGGYHIMLVRDVRVGAAAGGGDETVAIKQLFLPLEQGGNRDALVAQAQGLRGQIEGCDAMQARITASGSPMSGDVGKLRTRDLPAEIGRLVKDLEVGKASEPYVREQGVSLLMVCERAAAGETTLPSRDQVAEQLGLQRLDMLQQRYIRDLRASAFVDLRV